MLPLIVTKEYSQNPMYILTCIVIGLWVGCNFSTPLRGPVGYVWIIGHYTQMVMGQS